MSMGYDYNLATYDITIGAVKLTGYFLSKFMMDQRN